MQRYYFNIKVGHNFPTAIYFLYKKEEKHIPKIIYDIMGQNKFQEEFLIIYQKYILCHS